ncbi:MAG: fimbrillin family protein [Bacteroides sp.]|nr:fimbrillin family protein [Bacteroides sp.]
MKKRLIPFAAVAVIMASCSSEDVLEVNPEPAGQALSFSIAVGHTRATETTISNLGDFKIAAKGVHPSGGVFNSFLIGSTTDGEQASLKDAIGNNATSGVWELERDVYWPTSVDNALFWAWTCSQVKGGQKSDVLPSGKFDFTAPNKVKVTGFSPAKTGLKDTDVSQDMWADGLKQVDFVTAFKQASKTTNVQLDFEHVLSQIDIVAKSEGKAATDHRIVRIKGAWLVNTKDKADLESGFTWNAGTKEATHDLKWTNHVFKDAKSPFTAYGSFYKEPKVLDSSTGEQNLLGETLMLIPQEIAEWKKDDNEQGAYILLLCRVELKHDGTTHTTTPENPGADDDIAIYGDKHYHQQFPVNANKKFVEGEYGFVFVPVKATFKMGNKYKFILDICGASSGAGYYPPEADDIYKALLPTDNAGNLMEFTTNWGNKTNLTIVGRPSDKDINDFVLNEPIKFEVSVSPWDKNGDWKEGDVNL